MLRDDRKFGAWIPALALTVMFVTAGAGAAHASVDGVSIHGFLAQGFQSTSKYNYMAASIDGTLEYSEMGVNFIANASDDLRVGVQIFARDLGELGNNEIELDWAYGDYRHNDAIGFRAGKVKMPYGLYNETRDVDALRSSVLLPQSIYDERFRDFIVAVTGVSLYGNSPYTAAGSLEYQMFYGTTHLSETGSVGQALNATGAQTVTRFKPRHSLGAQLIWNAPVDGLRFAGTLNHFHWGFEAALSPAVLDLLGPLGAQPIETVESKNTRMLTGSGEYVWNNLTVAGEYSVWKGKAENPFIGFKLDNVRWYGSASYRINELVELGSYYSVYHDKVLEATALDVPHRGWQKDLTTSVRFDMTSFWLFKTEVHFINGTASLLLNEAFTLEKEDWVLFTAKTSFVF